MKKELNLPDFENEDEEREFRGQIDPSDFFEPADFERVSFPNLKPTTRPISIRFPEYVIDAVKEKANEMGVTYQALIKETIARVFVRSD